MQQSWFKTLEYAILAAIVINFLLKNENLKPVNLKLNQMGTSMICDLMWLYTPFIYMQLCKLQNCNQT